MRKTLLFLLLTAGLAAQPDLASLNVVPSRASGPPVQLTSSDGVGLRLTQYHAKVAVQGPLAFTELHLKFHNPQDRILEGRFEITLPEGAALSRLAMKNDKGWQEAEVVELQQARQAYEDFLHRKQDPALLEKQAGNQFQARIFPIPSAGEKEIIISYSQESIADYRLPASGLPKVDDLSVQATVWNGKEHEKLNYSLHSEPPKGDFVIHRPAGSKGLANGQDVLLVVKPQLQARTEIKQEKVLVLVDTSASRSAGFQRQIQTLKNLVAQWKEARVQLAAFDQDVVPLDLAQLSQRRPLGATDLAGALHWASQQKGYDRLLLVSDGVNTVGQDALKLSNFKRLDVLMVGGIRDSQSLQPLAYHSQAQSGYVLDGDRPVGELLNRLQSAPASDVKVAVQGADWVWPNRLDGVAPGEERVVYAHLSKPAQSVAVTVNGQSYQQALSTSPQPLLHRSSVAANLNRLSLQYRKATGSQKEEIARHMIELSTGNRVVCDLTGLLVLETEDDYKRFKIDRRALSDILVAGEQGVGVEKRSDINLSGTNPKPVVLQTNKSQPDADKAKEEEKAMAEPQAKQSASGMETLDLAHGAGRAQTAPASPTATFSAPRQAEGRVSSGVPTDSNGPIEAIGNRDSGIGSFQQAQNRPAAGGDDERVATRARRVAQATNPRPESRDQVTAGDNEESQNDGVAPLNGQFAQIDRLLRKGDGKQALQLSSQWQARSPGDVLALVAYGRSLQATGQLREAARAYGSIVDLYPGRADLRRYAGALLESLKNSRLAIDTFRQAVQQRPDHPSGARMLAYSLVKANRLGEAFQVLETALLRKYPDGRFADVQEILQDDLGMVAAAIIARDPDQGPRILKKLHALGVALASKPSLRFVLTWETDANDVDFHIKDAKGGHAYYSQPKLASGGRLYADVTTGYGPECFNIPGGGEAFPYNISIHYYSRGPMGYGMGKVEILRHDGKGQFRFEERPFVVMNDQAYVNLGQVQP
jgi:tetratricopeptide (TPR) repeat protein